LQDLLSTITSFEKFAASDQGVMAVPVRARKTSAAGRTRYIALGVIGAVMMLAILVGFLIFRHCKRKSARTAQPPEKNTVRLSSESLYEVPQRNVFGLLPAEVYYFSIERG
jgi:hypothetical protein